MQHDRVQVWLNQGGNGFALGAPILLPDGVFYDRLCQVTAADVQGTGMAELILSIPYITPTHWRLPFNSAKPYLLNGVNNNLGASHTLCYRSSAQSWLDEKEADPQAVPALPFAMHLLVKTLTLDEITGNQLAQTCRYYQGVYDGREREFRGFGYVETEDTSDDALPVGNDTPLAATLLTKSWYHCGREADETTLCGQPWQGDGEAVTLNPTLFTTYDDGQDKVLDAPDETTRWWLYRALKGALLHSETWTQGESTAPYTCTQQRMQVRLLQAGDMPIVLPLGLEQVASGYEQRADDPVVVQQVTLVRDDYGTPLQQVSVAYPRRAQHPLSPYPNNMPADAWDNTYDEQQQKLRLTESLVTVIHLTYPQSWRLGLLDTRRGNQLVFDSVPADGISYETLSDPNGLLADTQTRYLTGQSEVVYTTTPPNLLALVDHQRTAVLDSTALKAYDGVDIPEDYTWDKLGYVSMSDDAENPLWGTEHSFTRYKDKNGVYLPFYMPASSQSTTLVSAVSYHYDDYFLCKIGQSDSRNSTTATYDYRFLTPWRTTDINANTQEIQLNALGQALGGSVYGTENGGQKVGFGMVSDYPVNPALSIEQAIEVATTAGYLQQLASISVSDMFSWMGTVTESEANTAEAGGWSSLLENRFITFDGHIRPAGRRWAQKNAADPLAKLLTESEQIPVHSAVLTADNYPDTPDPDDAAKLLQQTAITVGYSDGFGRALQQCALVPDGKAWHRDEDGEVNTAEVDATPRWAVSGRVEYDNKGQVVRSYQPYFLDSWLYVTDASMRTQGYSDTLYYDALRRNIRTVTAKGYLRRNTWYSWFTVAEDENDTAGLPEEVSV
nr:toxin TcdB middle/C-terminal domain-containing protein [Pseudescherichia vulneris]